MCKNRVLEFMSVLFNFIASSKQVTIYRSRNLTGESGAVGRGVRIISTLWHISMNTETAA